MSREGSVRKCEDGREQDEDAATQRRKEGEAGRRERGLLGGQP